MIGVTAAASAGAYFIRGAIMPQIAEPVALGSVVDAVLKAARLLMFVAPGRLRLAFVAVLLILAVQMALAAFWRWRKALSHEGFQRPAPPVV